MTIKKKKTSYIAYSVSGGFFVTFFDTEGSKSCWSWKKP